jgi:hypothetical protein
MRASESRQPGLEETHPFCGSLVESDVGRVATLLGLGMAMLVGEGA